MFFNFNRIGPHRLPHSSFSANRLSKYDNRSACILRSVAQRRSSWVFYVWRWCKGTNDATTAAAAAANDEVGNGIIAELRKSLETSDFDHWLPFLVNVHAHDAKCQQECLTFFHLLFCQPCNSVLYHSRSSISRSLPVNQLYQHMITYFAYNSRGGSSSSSSSNSNSNKQRQSKSVCSFQHFYWYLMHCILQCFLCQFMHQPASRTSTREHCVSKSSAIVLPFITSTTTSYNWRALAPSVHTLARSPLMQMRWFYYFLLIYLCFVCLCSVSPLFLAQLQQHQQQQRRFLSRWTKQNKTKQLRHSIYCCWQINYMCTNRVCLQVSLAGTHFFILFCFVLYNRLICACVCVSVIIIVFLFAVWMAAQPPGCPTFYICIATDQRKNNAANFGF